MNSNSIFKFLAGTVLLGGVLLMAGCSKEKNEQTNNTTTTINSPYYLTGLLGTEAVAISGPSNPFVDTVTVFIDSNGHQCGGGGQNTYQLTQYITGANWTAVNTPADTPVIQGSIQLKKLSVRVYVAPIATPASNLLYSMLTSGPVAFADNGDPNDGAIISIRDSKGVVWTSLGNQTGSTFQINSTGNNMGTYAIVTGSINAKMYDGNGNVKQLTSTAFNAMVGL